MLKKIPMLEIQRKRGFSTANMWKGKYCMIIIYVLDKHSKCRVQFNNFIDAFIAVIIHVHLVGILFVKIIALSLLLLRLQSLFQDSPENGL